MVDVAFRQQIAKGDFQQHDDVVALRVRFPQELGAGAFEHVKGQFGQGPEAATLDEDRFFIKGLGGLDHLALGGEQGGLGQSLLNQLQAHEAVVHLGEGRPRELDQVHLDTFHRQVVKERADEGVRLRMEVKGAIDQVDADDAKGFLLLDVFAFEHADMKDNVRRRGLGLMLKAHSHPAVRFGIAAITAGGDGVGENEEFGGATALLSQPFQQEGILVVQHGLEALAANVTFTGAVDCIAEGHVVSRHGFGDGAGGAADTEEPTGDLLAGAGFGKGAVFSRIQINVQRLMMGVDDFTIHVGTL